MSTAPLRKVKTFRLRADLLDRLQQIAARENRTLNNFVESVLLNIAYDEPTPTTAAAIKEAKARKHYPTDELYADAEELYKALDAE